MTDREETTGRNTEEVASEPRSACDPEVWVDRHGDVLFRYALMRVGRRDVAEDIVQEALLAAFKAHDRFAGKSQERTWLIGILRHKIIDHLRSRHAGTVSPADDDHGDWLDGFFDEKGHWLRPPDPDAVDPQALLERREFWEVFNQCLEGLPVRSREAFVRRVLDNEDSEAICQDLGVTATNLWVILYRGRTQLRRCLMLRWFGANQNR